MTNKEIKLLTIDEEPNFKNCICIVCRKNHAEIVLDMGCHQTQLCKDCLQRLKHKLMEKQVRASSNSDEDCISRAELLKAMDTWDKFGVDGTNSLFRLDNLSLPHYVSYIHYDDVIKCIKGMPSIQPTAKENLVVGDCISREFIEIVVEYPPADLCIYPEYKGKPYFSIKYRENGNEYVGFGTYKIEILSQWIKEYFMPSIQPKPKTEPCEDCISRAELLKAIDKWDKFGVDDTNSLFRLDNLSLPHYVPYIHYNDVVKAIKGMPSVQPKSMQVELEGNGYSDGELVYDYGKCPKCGWEFEYGEKDWEEPYCCHCGQRLKWFESEDKE